MITLSHHVITLRHITKATATQPLGDISNYQIISYNLIALSHSRGTHHKLSRLRLLQHYLPATSCHLLQISWKRYSAS